MRDPEMLTPCEVAVKCALPSVRAMVADELMHKHHLKQAEAARLLGISQPAVSLYQKKLRGNSIDLGGDPDITALVAKHADNLMNGAPTYKDTIQSFCSICKIIRFKGFLCKIHKAFDPTIDFEKCDYCQTADC
jgi:predicted transcriptional regulator